MALVSGSVTKANSKLSLVAGTAFVDFSAINVLTPYIGSTLTIIDSSLKKLVGVIARAGTGETYSSELIAAWNNDGTNPFETLTIAAPNITAASNTAGLGYFSTNLGANSGMLVKIGMVLSVTSSDNLALQIAGSITGGAPVDTLLASGFTSQTLATYRTTYTSGLVQRYLVFSANAGGGNGTFSSSGTTAKQVLTPSTTGVFISSTFGSPTFSWASEETGFNRNDSSGYTYTISSPTGPGGGSLGWVRGPWGYLWAWSGLGCTWQ